MPTATATEFQYRLPDYLDTAIGDGRKDLEIIPKGFGTFKDAKAGDILVINNRRRRRIQRVTSYRNFSAALMKTQGDRFFPGLNAPGIMAHLRRTYSPAAESEGVVVIEHTSTT